MKNCEIKLNSSSIKIFSFLFLFFSCGREADIPKDTHNHDNPSKLKLVLVNAENPSDSVVAEHVVGNELGEDLAVIPGTVYNVSIKFMKRHRAGDYEMNKEFIELKDDHFIKYDFSNADIILKRREDDVVRSDGNRFGFETRWKIDSVGSESKLNIILKHEPTRVNQDYPSSGNQWGKASGGETDYDAWFNIKDPSKNKG
ncbi:MAG: hypothetical protein FDW93_03635 [Bergeyella sp.]|nr:hypothetical protein [Bergeyella sp.]